MRHRREAEQSRQGRQSTGAVAKRIACSLGISAVVMGTPFLATAATAQADGLPIQWEPCGILDGWWYCGPTGNSVSKGATGPSGSARAVGAKGAAGPTASRVRRAHRDRKVCRGPKGIRPA